MRDAGSLIKRGLIASVLLGLVLTGCASANKSAAKDTPEQLARLQKVEVRETGESTMVVITLDKPVSFTSVRMPDPPRMVVDLAGVDMGGFTETTKVDKPPVTEIKPVKVPNAPRIGRLEIALSKNTELKTTQDGGTINILFAKDAQQKQAEAKEAQPKDAQAKEAAQAPAPVKPEETKAAAATAPEQPKKQETAAKAEQPKTQVAATAGQPKKQEAAAPGQPKAQTAATAPEQPKKQETAAKTEQPKTQVAATAGQPKKQATAALTAKETKPSLPPAKTVKEITALKNGESYQVSITGDGSFASPECFMLGKDRIVVDVPGVGAVRDKGQILVGAGMLKRVRMAAYKDKPVKVRVVLDLGSPAEYEVKPDGNNLVVTVSPVTKKAPETASAKAPEKATVTITEKAPASTDAKAGAKAPAPAAVTPPAKTAQAAPAGEAKAAVKAAAIAPAKASVDATVTTPAKTASTEPVKTAAKVAPVKETAPAKAAEPAKAPASAATAEAKARPGAPARKDGINVYISRDGKAVLSSAPIQDSESLSKVEDRTRDYVETQTKIYTGGRISFDIQDADLDKVIGLLADVANLNLIIDPSEVKGKVTLKLDSVPWDQALDILLRIYNLDKVIEGNVLRVASKSRLDDERRRDLLQQAEQKKLEQQAQDLYTRTFKVNFMTASELEPQVKKILSSRGDATANPRTNELVVTDISENIEKAGKLIAVLDKEVRQIMIEARIVKVDVNYSQSLGVSWGLSKNSKSTNPQVGIGTNSEGLTAGTDGPNGAHSYQLDLPTSVGSAAGGFLGSLSWGSIFKDVNIDLTISALESINKAEALAAPKVFTLENQAASITSGTTIYVQTTTAAGTAPQPLNANLSLTVTPRVTGDNLIVMEVTATNNLPGTPVANAVATIETQSVTTRVLVKDGDTIVLGGIYTKNKSKDSSHVPILGRIPIIKYLFSDKSWTDKTQELLIFITPKIMTTAAQV